MNKQVVRALAMTGLLAVMVMVAAVSSAQGQTANTRMTANVPFDFGVANKTFPAGEYLITRAQPDSSDLVLLIMSVDGHSKMVKITIPISKLEPGDKSKLVFHRYGEQYFLSEVWTAGSSVGRGFLKSRREREAEDNARDSVGALNKKPQTMETVNIVIGQ